MGSALCAVLVLSPTDARADDRCAKRCAQTQASCTVSCADRVKCRQRCVDSADTCFTKCQQADDKREAAQQRRGEKNCVGDDGRMRKCTAAEEAQMRETTKQASKMFCRDANGEQVICPDQARQLEEARKFVPKDCPEAGCEDEQN
jgi:hypothetical protein